MRISADAKAYAGSLSDNSLRVYRADGEPLPDGFDEKSFLQTLLSHAFQSGLAHAENKRRSLEKLAKGKR